MPAQPVERDPLGRDLGHGPFVVELLEQIRDRVVLRAAIEPEDAHADGRQDLGWSNTCRARSVMPSRSRPASARTIMPSILSTPPSPKRARSGNAPASRAKASFCADAGLGAGVELDDEVRQQRRPDHHVRAPIPALAVGAYGQP
uniref:hypothetical protein n=1 Tax=Kitasatospora sp. NBC_01519 TaxID=2903576 RepID=UPI002F9170F3